MIRKCRWLSFGRSILLTVLLGRWSLATAEASPPFSSTAWRQHPRPRDDQRTVHTRLSHALQYHPEFENTTTLPIVQQMLPRRGLRDSDHAAATAAAATATASATSNNEVPWTLNQARIIHKFALDATHGVQRSHGHVVVVPRSSSDSGYSSSMTGCQPKPAAAAAAAFCSSPKRLFVPSDYGADPTGVHDSTEAFAKLMQDFLLLSPSAPHSFARPMAANITNLGGATLDLQGGTYLLSQPIFIPPMYGNAHIMDGTLQANSLSFPSDRWLIEIGHDEHDDESGHGCHPKAPDGKDDIQYSCNEFIDVTRVLLDANFVAAGGVKVSRVMGTTLNEIFVTGFVQVGIFIQDGHEVMISNAWLAECYWSANQYCLQQHSTSVGIRIHGMDHYLTNIIVFDYAKVGVEVLQPANILEGVHTWNGGGNGIVVKSNTIRLIGCYLDYETLDLWDPIVDVLVESTFFYYGHVVLHAGGNKDKNDESGSTINGLILRFNHYNNNESVVLDGTFETIQSVSVQEEWGGGGGGLPIKTTRASLQLSLPNATEWTLDFSDQLLFPSLSIDHVTYSLASSSTRTVVSHMARPPNGTRVTVVTSEPINATVYMTVEQGMNR